MASDECENFDNCTINGRARVCFLRDANSDRVNFCGCSDWFGFVGENCDQPSSTSRYSLFTSSTFVLWAFFLFYVNIRLNLVHLSLYKSALSANPTASKQKKGKVVVRQISILIGLSTILLLTAAILNHISLQNPQDFIVFREDSFAVQDREVVGSRLEVGSRHLSLLAALIQVLALFLVLKSWITVLESIDRFLPESEGEFLSAAQLKVLIRVVFPVSVSLVVALQVLNLSVETRSLLILICISETILFFVVHKRFVVKLDKYNYSNEHFDKVHNMISRASKFFLSHLIATIILFSVKYVSISIFIDVVDFEGFNFVLLLRDTAVWVTFIGLTYLSWYTYVLMCNLYSSNSGWIFPTTNKNSRTSIESREFVSNMTSSPVVSTATSKNSTLVNT